MITTAETQAQTTANWRIGNTPDVLDQIHQPVVNLAIHERQTADLAIEIKSLLADDVKIKLNGTPAEILGKLVRRLPVAAYPRILKDVESILTCFRAITGAQSYRLLLSTVRTDMCRRFHTDINSFRLICTYHGPGTQWITDDNVDRAALNVGGNTESIALDDEHIRHAPTGAVIILKGALYPFSGTRAIVHRSPAIEASGAARLLLRIDTDEMTNLWG